MEPWLHCEDSFLPLFLFFSMVVLFYWLGIVFGITLRVQVVQMFYTAVGSCMGLETVFDVLCNISFLPFATARAMNLLGPLGVSSSLW